MAKIKNIDIGEDAISGVIIYNPEFPGTTTIYFLSYFPFLCPETSALVVSLNVVSKHKLG